MSVKLSEATNSAVQTEQAVASKLETALQQERAKAKQERQQLLSQITHLIDESAEQQESRWASQIESIKGEVTDSATALTHSRLSHSEGMATWSKKESTFVDDILKSRETLKIKMKEDWRAVNDHNLSIQSTTKSVHQETIRIVDAQMNDIATQMKALDDFVTRARSQNEQHHRSHLSTLQSLASNVHQSYDSIGGHFVSNHDRVRNIGSDISAQGKDMAATLPTLDLALKEPLAHLRADVSATSLQDYVPTGRTPKRIQYNHPTVLPRTEPNHSAFPVPPSPNRSPSKAPIFTDHPSSDTSSTSPSKNSADNTASLREISLNVGLNRTHSDTAMIIPRDGKTEGAVSLSASMNGMPPLKRQATESKLPMKLRGGGAVARAEKENLGASLGSGRRLRSRDAEV